MMKVMPVRPRNIYDQYHAHVYFDQSTVAQATQLCEQAGIEFGVKVGRIHQKRVGPHPHWSCQLAFSHDQFDPLISWLEAHRQTLNILIHGLTGNDLADHTDHASWLGDSTPLHLNMFMQQKQ